MRFDSASVHAAFCSAYQARDLDRAIALLSDDVILSIYIDRTIVPFGGTTIGRAAALRRFAWIREKLDVLAYRRVFAVCTGETMRGTIAYHARDKATGEEITGGQRHLVETRDGMICRLRIYHDQRLMEAFIELVNWHEAGMALADDNDDALDEPAADRTIHPHAP
jgi:ketosteroid isomerase-like protein